MDAHLAGCYHSTGMGRKIGTQIYRLVADWLVGAHEAYYEALGGD